MLRYNLSPRNPEDSDLDICIGWDAPLSTFFAHVIRTGSSDDLEIEDVLLMVGNRLNEVQSVEDLANLLSAYTDIPYSIKNQLILDMAKPYERSPFQDWMIEKGLVF